jgi:SAM-dependent methyltransferase
MRSIKQKIRRRLLRVLNVSPDYANVNPELFSVDDNIGSEMVGSRGHREYVGGLWEVLGTLQFRYMVQQGLEPQHVLLDIACGSLRAGVRIIPYLDRGNYLGFEIEQRLIDIGIRQELGLQLYEIKRPEFVVSDAFEFERFSKQPDFVLAHAVFTQLTEADILACLENLRRKAKSSTRLYATFNESDGTVQNPARSDPHLSFYYTQKQMFQFGKASGWSTRYIGDWNHPRRQKMLEYSPR